MKATTNGRRTQNNGQMLRVRLSGNVTPGEKKRWFGEIKRSAAVDGIHNPDSGTFLSRIINSGLRLDQASIANYVKTHKDRRDEDPARS